MAAPTPISTLERISIVILSDVHATTAPTVKTKLYLFLYLFQSASVGKMLVQWAT
jgi:hypothetical protein